MNPVALITGGSRGIGRGIALELAKAGWDLLLNYVRNETAAQEAARECREAARRNGNAARIELCAADISQPAERQRLLEFCRARFGRLDSLVNNAGVAPLVRADLLETTEASFDRLMNINVKGPFFLTQQAARWMLETHGDGAVGARVARSLITISSVSAYAASTNRGEYCISKAALSMLTPLFAARLAEHDINVYEVRPGIIATDMTAPVKEKYDQLIRDGLTPIKRWGTPEDVGKAVAALAQGALPFSTGEVLNVDGGFHIRRL